jgi:hypothetical protein
LLSSSLTIATPRVYGHSRMEAETGAVAVSTHGRSWDRLRSPFRLKRPESVSKGLFHSPVCRDGTGVRLVGGRIERVAPGRVHENPDGMANHFSGVDGATRILLRVRLP